MINAFGASIGDADAKTIADYLRAFFFGKRQGHYETDFIQLKVCGTARGGTDLTPRFFQTEHRSPQQNLLGLLHDHLQTSGGARDAGITTGANISVHVTP
jgi:hypothetical protein